MNLVVIEKEELANLIRAEIAPLAAAIAELRAVEKPKPEPQPEPEEPAQPEPQGVTAQVSNSTGGEWQQGVSVQTPRFMIRETSQARAAFVKGATVKFSNGQSRKITDVVVAHGNIYPTVEGDKLPPSVGYPNTVTAVKGDSEEAEPDGELPASKPDPAPVGKGQVFLNLGLGMGGDTVLPGKHGQHYNFPNLDEWKQAAAQGFKRARVGFLWERAIRGGAGTGNLDEAHMQLMHQTASYAAQVGMTILWDMHNYTGYSTTSTSKDRKKIGAGVPIEALGNDWKVIAKRLMSNPVTRRVTYGFDLMNEPIISWDIWKQAVQHAINQVASVAPDKVCGIEGIAYSSTINWVKNNPGMENITHPNGDEFLEFHGHLYLDERASGYWDTPKDKTGKADPMLGVNRIRSFAEWGKKHGKKLAIGETMAPGIYPEFVKALDNMLAFNVENGIDTYVFFAARGAGDNWHNINKPENKPTLDVILKWANA